MDDIMVSICCLVYNHEKYLRQCLDGFMMQHTNFKFEVLIHDDASTDGSVDIIREYEKKYPDIVKPIYQNENQHSKGVRIGWTYQYPRVKGKYIAMCEGDDFWTDENKLQMQYEALETHKDCHFCACTVRHVSENGEALQNKDPSERYNLSENCVLQSEKWIEMLFGGGIIFQTSSYFFNAEHIKKIISNRPKFFDLCPVGDVPLMQYFAQIGNMYYINEEMSCYRKSSIGSWTSTALNTPYKQVNNRMQMIESYIAFDSYTNLKYHKLIEHSILKMEFNAAVILKDYKKVLNKKYREIFNERSIKERTLFIISAYFPCLIKIYHKLKDKNDQ